MSLGQSHPFVALLQRTGRSVVMQSRTKNSAEGRRDEETQATFAPPYQSFEFTQCKEEDIGRAKPFFSAFVVAPSDWLQNESKHAVEKGIAEAFSRSCDEGAQQFTYSVGGAQRAGHNASSSEPYVSCAMPSTNAHSKRDLVH